MNRLYPPWANSLFWIGTGIVVVGVLSIPIGLMVYVRTPYITNVRKAVEQPIQFDHRHHVLDDAIDCLYCHHLADRSDWAGVPSTEVCLGCHGQIWHDAPLLEPLRESFFYDQPIRWNRVHGTPDFTFFSHQIHIHRGVGCSSCHGRVDEMAVVFATQSLQMHWCLDCHREPERYLRPPDKITDMDWNPPPLEQRRIGLEIKERLRIAPPTNCTACHR